MPYVYVDPLDLAIRDPYDYGRLIRRIQDRQWRVERALNRFYYELPIIVRKKYIDDGLNERTVRVIYSWRGDILAGYPKFTKHLFDASVTSGRNLQLEVRVNGYPKPEVKWYKNSKEIVETDNIKITHYYPNSYVLSIYNAIPADRGLYTCRATNAAGTTTTMGLVHVEPYKSSNLPLRPTFYDTLYALE